MAMSDKWAEQFAHMEALLSRGNIFTAPVSTFKPVASQHLISETPLLAPTTRPTGPVEAPVALDAQVKPKVVDQKIKRKATNQGKGRKPKTRTVNLKRNVTCLVPKQPTISKQGRSASPPAVPSSGPESIKQPGSKMDYHQTAPASEKDTTGSTGQAPVYPGGHGQPSGGAMCLSAGTERFDF